MSAAEFIIDMRSVGIAFNGKPALSDLSFQVSEGEIFGFLGPSGAGKTTTIKLLTRQLRPDAGSIRVFGEDIHTLSPDAYDQVGVLSDTSGLYERLSVYDNVRLFADLMRAPRSRVMETLERLGLQDDAKKSAKKLSRGMKQRLMLGRAVIHHPRLLFLDEPTASLDPGTTLRIHQMLKELNQSGATIFLTTHDMAEADRLCRRVAFLHKGAVVACDTPEALKLNHARDEVAVRSTDGRTLTGSKSIQSLRNMLDQLSGDVMTIHSSEPNLEEIFLKLTGSDLS